MLGEKNTYKKVDSKDKILSKRINKRNYDNLRRNKKPNDEGYLECTVDECENNICYLGKYCSRHYTQLRLYGEIFKSRFDKNEVIYHKDYAEIILNDQDGNIAGKTKVDLHKVDELLEYKWSVKDGRYARSRNTELNEDIVMARLLLNVLDDNTSEVTYINKDTFDNRMKNLVILSRRDITRRAKISSNNTSGTKGVSCATKDDRWRAYITVDGKQISLGYHLRRNDAIEARRKAELYYFGFTHIRDEA